MMTRPSHHDEHRGFERATKRNSRPRTKTRPEHAAAEIGFVTGVDRGRYTVIVSDDAVLATPDDAGWAGLSAAANDAASQDAACQDAGGHEIGGQEIGGQDIAKRDLTGQDISSRELDIFESPAHAPARPGSAVLAPDPARRERDTVAKLAAGTRTVLAMKARELNRERVTVGDQVLLVGDTSGGPDALARIVRIADRTSVLRRTADDNDPYERVIVANADQLMVVTALADPPPRVGMIDRAVVAAYEAGIDATLVLTKADLGSPAELQSLYESAGVRVIVTRPAQTRGFETSATHSPQPTGFAGEAASGLPSVHVAPSEVRGFETGLSAPPQPTGFADETAQSQVLGFETSAAHSPQPTDFGFETGLSAPPQPTDFSGGEPSVEEPLAASRNHGTLGLAPESVAEVLAALRGRVTVLLGHSGVGKSTLVNALVPGAGRLTGIVNETTGRGRQTSTSAVALPLPTGDGWVVDTPGIRSLGIAHVQTEQVVAAFPDLDIVADAECPRGCTHLADSPDCALDAWVTSDSDPEVNAARAQRLDSLRRLLAARAAAATSLADHASMLERRAASTPNRRKK